MMLLFSSFPRDELELALGDVLVPPRLDGELPHATMSSATAPMTTGRAARMMFVIIGALLHAGQAICQTSHILVIYRGPLSRGSMRIQIRLFGLVKELLTCSIKSVYGISS
jgi:hypothetical protein